MKNYMRFLLIFTLFLNCDPVSDMEANIENLTTQDLTIDFISFDETLNKSLLILPNKTVLFQEGFEVGNTFLEPSLVDYDSIVIRNSNEAILKIYKESDTGKNIYNINDYWIGSEPSKKSFRYLYQINSEDIE